LKLKSLSLLGDVQAAKLLEEEIRRDFWGLWLP